MNPEIKARWVQALRSGEYRQGRGNLREGGDHYCCLGVLCEIAVQGGVIRPPALVAGAYRYGQTSTFSGDRAYLPAQVQEWAGLTSQNPHVMHPVNRQATATLSGLNDYDYTFEQIADVIEEQL